MFCASGCPRLRSYLSVPQAPVSWWLDVNRVPIRNSFAIAGVVITLAGINRYVSSGVEWVSFVVVLGLVALCAAMTGILAKGLVASPHAELSTIIASLTVLIASGASELLVSDDPIFRSRTHAQLLVLWKLVPAIFSFPLYGAAILALWSVVVDIASLELLRLKFGDRSQLRQWLYSVLFAVFGLGVTIMSGSRLYRVFSFQQALSAERKLLVSLLSMMCDATAWLAESGDVVLRADQRFHMLLGRDVTGQDVCLARWRRRSGSACRAASPGRARSRSCCPRRW